jgi:hypothetical protein
LINSNNDKQIKKCACLSKDPFIQNKYTCFETSSSSNSEEICECEQFPESELNDWCVIKANSYLNSSALYMKYYM